MTASKMTLSDILYPPALFSVPLFQRRYVWELDENWWPLWTDIVETTSRLMDDLAAGSKNPTRPHFLGAVVHEGMKGQTGKIAELRLIDGQQRMTTLQLVLAATQRVAGTLGDDDVVTDLRALTHNPTSRASRASRTLGGRGGAGASATAGTAGTVETAGMVGAGGAPDVWLFKVCPTNADRADFAAAVQGHPNGSGLGQAYTFFLERVSAFVTAADPGPGPNQQRDADGRVITAADQAPVNENAPTVGAAAEAASPQERLDALATTLSSLLTLVVIELDAADDDAQAIFETLNARGKDLLGSDLVKNHMFNRAQNAGLDVGQLNATYWSPLDDPWFTDRISVGRVWRTHLDLGVSYWTAIHNARGSDITAAHMFDTFRGVARAQTGPVQEPDRDAVLVLFQSVAHHVLVYRALRNSAYDSVEGRFVARMDALGTSTPMPLVVWLAGQLHPDDLPALPDGPAVRKHALGAPSLPREQFERALHAIESYLVRRAACGLTAKNYNRYFSQLLNHLRLLQEAAGPSTDAESMGRASGPQDAGESGGPVDLAEALVAFLVAGGDPSTLWPDDESFISALEDEPQYRRPLRTRGVRMVLEAIESAMRGADVEQLAPPTHRISPAATLSGLSTVLGSRLTVEHILPQSWRDNWPLPDTLTPEQVQSWTEERTTRLHTLGNLTLITGTRNSKLKNNAWSAKRADLAMNSLLLITQSTVLTVGVGPSETRPVPAADGAPPEDWWALNPNLAIRQRGMVLAAWAAERVWPRG